MSRFGLWLTGYRIPVAIPGGTGTNIGTLIAGGGLSALFDGTTSKADAACGQQSGVSPKYGGKNYSSSPKHIAKADVYPSNASHWFSASDGVLTVTLTLYGKNGSEPAIYSDGTVLGSMSFLEDGTAPRTISSSDLSTAWDYAWIAISASSSTGTIYCAQIIFYEP